MDNTQKAPKHNPKNTYSAESFQKTDNPSKEASDQKVRQSLNQNLNKNQTTGVVSTRVLKNDPIIDQTEEALKNFHCIDAIFGDIENDLNHTENSFDVFPDKYIFVTGGVVSGLGKGITAASVGLILKENGILVDATKFDPYLNIDPGTMSPHEHGEIYVLQDGAETNLDLGHYERFLDTNLNNQNSVTTGKICSEILKKRKTRRLFG